MKNGFACWLLFILFAFWLSHCFVRLYDSIERESQTNADGNFPCLKFQRMEYFFFFLSFHFIEIFYDRAAVACCCDYVLDLLYTIFLFFLQFFVQTIFLTLIKRVSIASDSVVCVCFFFRHCFNACALLLFGRLPFLYFSFILIEVYSLTRYNEITNFSKAIFN